MTKLQVLHLITPELIRCIEHIPDTGRVLLGRPLNDYEFKSLSTLGWLTELLQAFFLAHDNIMHKSMTRRGQNSWYR
ncbi:unnamed protein product [Penicillium nalgiovense]|nr:unnamed protein product [Penicillium nalgiovense]